MKPVIQKIIEKNGGEEMRFNPTASMIAFAAFRARLPALSDADVCEKAGIASNSHQRWQTKYGSMYSEWLEEIKESFFDDKAAILETVGMVHATQGNFNYWKEMAKTHGVIKDDQGPKTVTINTDFSAILLGGNLENARERLMHELRGILPAPRSEPQPLTVEVKPIKKKDLDLEF